jgi:mannose-1-phosphate guanylyltransferase
MDKLLRLSRRPLTERGLLVFAVDGPRRIGACATEPDTEYRLDRAGGAVGATASGSICRVARFREKPTPPDAAMCLARKWLWNTFVMVAKARTLLSVADVLLPELTVVSRL